MKEMKKLGFGMMRLPLKGEDIDFEEVSRMVDLFIKEGFTYFDTAHGYVNGNSEVAVRKCLTERYPRDKYLLADKLTEPYFQKKEDIEPFILSQLDRCGVTYFDYYLMHAQGSRNYDKFVRCEAYEVALKLKNEGKIKHLGLSFHDTPEMLERILTEKPFVEFVQLQFNYLDYESARVQSRACYEVCEKYGKKVAIMEPVKGGRLASLPHEASKILKGLNGGSDASYAVRFAASFPSVYIVLSGMSNLAQMEDNTSYMKDFVPLNEVEKEAISKVTEILNNEEVIACTACEYCLPGCPKHIKIPELFSLYNQEKLGHGEKKKEYLAHDSLASACIKCGACERVCPQKLPIRDLLVEVAKTMEN